MKTAERLLAARVGAAHNAYLKEEQRRRDADPDYETRLEFVFKKEEKIMSKTKTTPSYYKASVIGQVGAAIDAVRPLWLAAAVPTMRSVRGALANELAFIDREIANKIAREASEGK